MLPVKPLAVLAVAAMAMAACSSSSKSSSTSTTSTTAASATTSAPATGPGTPAPKPLATKTSVTLAVTAKIEVFSEPEVALMEGEFAKENLNVTVQVEPANSVPQLLAQGTVQAALNGINAGAYNAIHSGVGLTVVGDPYTYMADDPTGLWVNTKDLNADGTLKTPLPSGFAVSLGQAGINAPSILQTEQYLERSGLTYNNVTNVALAQPDIITALVNGRLQAGYANTPFANTLVGNPSFKKVTGTALAVGDVLVGQTYLQQHRDVVLALMRALIRTARTYFAPGYRSNAQVMGVIANWIGVPAATVTKSGPVSFSQDMAVDPLIPILTQMQQVWIKLGNVLQYNTPIPTSQLADSTVASDAVAGK
jgi:NitT/TauT family transport system substrate-binding protein